MAGKNEYNITVNFPGDKSLIGQIVRVKITSAGESNCAANVWNKPKTARGDFDYEQGYGLRPRAGAGDCRF